MNTQTSGSRVRAGPPPSMPAPCPWTPLLRAPRGPRCPQETAAPAAGEGEETGRTAHRLSRREGGCAPGWTAQPHPTSWGVIARRDGHSTEEGVWISSCVETQGRTVRV